VSWAVLIPLGVALFLVGMLVGTRDKGKCSGCGVPVDCWCNTCRVKAEHAERQATRIRHRARKFYA
jgi:hypothetical protein